VDVAGVDTIDNKLVQRHLGGYAGDSYLLVESSTLDKGLY